ncbi:penicillin-binding protein [Lottiidibacillus patelloidae]|uniref:serine-type D-Ala-D-Ala carboxypeptidase n=1 Tax=Lottiidibacillus patelloidae TaxID=2670334 RepID=A0A263BWC0_9BACI|nr:penicillin-binding protein [Lottiidibacillus patelloidae]
MQIKKRAFLFVTVFILLFLTAIARLAYIQLIATKNFEGRHINLIEESVNQRTQSYLLDYGRGRFVDRNNKKLTHEQYPVLILFPFLKQLNWPVDKIAAIIGIDKEIILNQLAEEKTPFALRNDGPIPLTEKQMEQINALQIPGVYVQYKHFTITDHVAQPLIGVIGEDPNEIVRLYKEKVTSGLLARNTEIGKTGLQKAFDPFVITEGPSKLLYHVDGRGGPLFGMNVKYVAPANPFYPITVQTSLNKDIQIAAEKIVDQHGITNGGLVLLDVETSDLIAMVSRPIDLKDPFGRGKNEMLSLQIPGSTFKIVVAAAAIEKNMIERGRIFDCSKNVRGDGLAPYDFGKLTFKDSFARSCNYTFATLAKEMAKIDENILHEYAEKLGLVSRVSWQGRVFHYDNFSHLPIEEEQVGRVWLDKMDKKDENYISQTAIGQQDVRVTPLALANMMATIARGGIKKQVRTAKKIMYKDGSTLVSFANDELDDNKIAPFTALKLKELLEHVVDYELGTGRTFRNLPYKVAGKSGTAQITTEITNKNHHWFAGYFPAEKPKYALVVVNLEKDKDKKAFHVFKDLLKYIHSYEQSHEH